jgi:hypothetical protein
VNKTLAAYLESFVPTVQLTPTQQTQLQPQLSTTQLLSQSTVRAALMQSIDRSIYDDARMWAWDSGYAAKRSGTGFCGIRSKVEPWSPAGECGLNRIDCNYSVYELQVRCGPEAFQTQMWQLPRYVWAQGKLRMLLANKPGPYFTPDKAADWASWCVEVASLISLARWSTNIRDSYAGKLRPGSTGTTSDVYDSTPYLLPLEGPKAKAFWDRVDMALASGRYGEHAATTPVRPLTIRNLNDSATSGWHRDAATGRIVQAAPDIPKSKRAFAPSVLPEALWPVSWAEPVGMRPNSIGVNQPVYVVGRPSSDLDALTTLFRHSQERELLVKITRRRVQGERYASGILMGTYIGGHGLVEYLSAVAADAVIDRPYARWVAHGFKVWNDAFVRIPADLRRNLLGSLSQAAQMSMMANEAKADEVFMGTQLALSSAGAIASMVPVVGWAVGIAVAVVQALLTIMHEVLKATDSYATGAGSIPVCPPPPVIRIIAGGQECDWDSPDRDGLKKDQLEKEVEKWTGGTPLLTSPLLLPELQTYLPPQRTDTSTSGGGVVVGLGAAAALIYLLRGR